jgi:hypothetical protein
MKLRIRGFARAACTHSADEAVGRTVKAYPDPFGVSWR